MSTVLLLLTFALFGQAGTVNHSGSDALHSSVVIKRLGCLNGCPEYRLEVRDNGSVPWHGYSHVATVGPAQSEVDPVTVQELFAEIFGHERVSVCRTVQGLDGEESVLLFSANGDVSDLEKLTSSEEDLSRAASRECPFPASVRDTISAIERRTDSHGWMHGSESILEPIKVWEDATYRTKPGFTELMAAVALDDVSRISKLARPEEVNRADDTGWTPLMVAASQCNIEGVKKLLENGAELNHADQRHQTALMAGVSARCFRSNRPHEESKARGALSSSLIGAGAAINVQDDDGETALIVAVKSANPEGTRALLSAGADPSIADRHGAVPLTYAKSLQQAVHRTYTPPYWNRYDECYREIIGSLIHAHQRKAGGSP